MRFTVILDANRPDGTIAAIHRHPCAAASADMRPGAVAVAVDGSLRDALDVAVDEADRDLGYGDEDARIHACAR